MYSYSSRLHWSFSSNRLTRLLQQFRSAGQSFLDLTISNPTVALPAYPHAAIAKAYSEIQSFRYDPEPAGALEARSAIARYYEELNIAVEVHRILLTASTSEAYGLLFKLLCDPGDEVLIPVPSYPLFEYLASLESVRTVPYHLRYDGSWFLDFQEIDRKFSNRTRALVIVSPHNPTGSFLKAVEAEQLLEWANTRGIPVIADEVFLNYKLSSNAAIAPSLAAFQHSLSFSLNGLSKAAGMPQMKLGWIVINGPRDESKPAKDRLELLLDTYLSVATPVQAALPRLLEIGAVVRLELQSAIQQNLAYAREALRHSAASPLLVEGGWSLIVKLPALIPEEEWVLTLLKQESVLVQPGYFFDMPSEAYVVLSLIAPPDQFQEGLRRIVKHVGRIAGVTPA